jgi:hypothetical protein
MADNDDPNKAPSEPRKNRSRLPCGCLCALAALVAILVCMWPAVQNAREATRYCWCNNQFKQIALGIHNYAQTHRVLPSAYTVDSQGRPLHSWRVLLLPFIELNQRYQQIRLDEPWNSRHNASLADWPVDPEETEWCYMYLCPSDWDAPRNDASRFVFEGPHAPFDGSRTRRFEDFKDGTSNTALGGEMSESGIHWMEPRDLNVEEMSFTINDKSRSALRSNHPHCVNMPFVDGSVHTIHDDIDPNVLKALITIDGGEKVNPWQ